MIKQLLAKIKHRKFCKLNHYYCPDCIYHDFIFEGAIFRGNRCRWPIQNLPSVQSEYEELTPEEAASEIASGSTMSAWHWLDDMIRLKQMGYVICRKK